MAKIRLGCDPEVFLQNNEGKHISVIGMIKASKWNPMQIPDMAQGFTLQEDNVALEYGIPPASNADEFVAHIQAVMQKSLEYLPGLSFSNLSCTIFDEDQMQNPMAHMFGCEPDYNAWTRKQNKKPEPSHPFMRSAGGHIHVETKRDAYEGVKLMDLYLGVPSVLMDKGEQRKQLYGKAGACRKKPYGFEYRTLSNFWIFKEELIRWAWRNTERAMDTYNIQGEDEEAILDAINNNNKEAAKYLVNKHNLEVLV